MGSNYLQSEVSGSITVKSVIVPAVRITTIPAIIRIAVVVAIVVIVVELGISISFSLVHVTVVEVVHVRAVLPVVSIKSRHPSISFWFSIRDSFSLEHSMAVEIVHSSWNVGHSRFPVVSIISRLEVIVAPLSLSYRKGK